MSRIIEIYKQLIDKLTDSLATERMQVNKPDIFYDSIRFYGFIAASSRSASKSTNSGSSRIES